MFSNTTTSQKVVWFFVILLISISTFSSVQAGRGYFGLKPHGSVINWGENWQPPRGVAILNVQKEHSSGLYTNLQGVCYDLLEKENKPFYGYLEVGFHLGNLAVGPTIGWSFRDKELVAGLRLHQDSSIWRGYSNLEYQFETKSFYYQGQISLKFNAFFDLGGEVEGWGDIDDNLTSHGFGAVFGFNLQALRLVDNDSKLRIEAAIQLRELMDQWKPQAIVRFSFTPKMDEHTIPKRRN